MGYFFEANENLSRNWRNLIACCMVGNDCILQESVLVRAVSLLAALEIKADSIDVGDGVLVMDKDTLYDHNWRNCEYVVKVCGYFPADNPKYSILVSINKKKESAGGAIVGDVFRQIVNIINVR